MQLNRQGLSFLLKKTMIISWKGTMFCWEKKAMKNIEILKYYTVEADSSKLVQHL